MLSCRSCPRHPGTAAGAEPLAFETQARQPGGEWQRGDLVCPPMGGASPPLFASPPPSLPLQQDCPVCWICLDSTGTLMFPCKCPRCAAAPPAPAPCCACTLLPVAVLLCSWSCKRKHCPSLTLRPVWPLCAGWRTLNVWHGGSCRKQAPGALPLPCPPCAALSGTHLLPAQAAPWAQRLNLLLQPYCVATGRAALARRSSVHHPSLPPSSSPAVCCLALLQQGDPLRVLRHAAARLEGHPDAAVRGQRPRSHECQL
jgi:hypothetical protein